MSDHTTALVPIEAWCFNSPEVRYKGNHIDVGLFAESLIYYDRILLNVGNPSQFAELIKWLVENDNYQDNERGRRFQNDLLENRSFCLKDVIYI